MNIYQFYGKIGPWATPAPAAIALAGRLFAPNFDLYNWVFFGADGTMRKGWGIFFSLGLGLFLAFYAATDAPVMFWLALLYASGVAQFALFRSTPAAEVRTEVAGITHTAKPHPIPYGVIYVMRRSDGIYKIGKTHYLRNRLRSHRIDYGQGFDVVASWVVPNSDRYEMVALDLTYKYHYCEGNRKELRKMNEVELNQFVLDFTERVYSGFKKAQN